MTTIPEASAPSGARPPLYRTPGFVGWVIVAGIWIIAFVAAVAYGMSISKQDALWAVPAMMLVVIALPLYLVCLGLWFVLTRRTLGRAARVLAHALPWIALLSPASCLETGWLRGPASTTSAPGSGQPALP